jgi:hypothetical protein
LDSPRPTELLDVVRRLTLLQIDPTAAIAASADLVAWSRLGSSYSPAELDKALEDRTLLEHRWALLNLPIPAALLDRAATARVERPSTGTIARVTENWRRYATWLAGRGITSLGDVEPAVHEEYATHIAGQPLTQRTQIGALYAVGLLWGFTPHLPVGIGIPMPPWEAEGMARYLSADAGSNENLTPPIHPPSCRRCWSGRCGSSRTSRQTP